MAPFLNCCREPPSTLWMRDVGRPGRHMTASYRVRIGPVMFLSSLIQMRPSQAPIAHRSSDPVIEAEPLRPRTVARMMRPPAPRRTAPNPRTRPIEPVYGDSRLVSSAAVSDFCQSVHGFAAVSSPGSHSALR
jgi:hypothetical protein